MKKSLKGRKVWITGLTKETDERVRCIAVKLSKIDKNGELNPFYGKHHKDCTKLLLSIVLKGNVPPIKGKTYEEYYGVDKANEMKENQRQNGYRYFPSGEPTAIEVKLQELLTFRGLKFETQKLIYGRPDIFIEPNICIFADGIYWHAYPGKYKSDAKMIGGKTAQQIWDKDKRITDYLTNKGYTVLRFWEHEIHNNLEHCVSKIEDLIGLG